MTEDKNKKLNGKFKRNTKMLEMFRSGKTQTEIAKEFGLSRERVRLLLSSRMKEADLKKQVKVNLKKKSKKTIADNKGKGIKYICETCGNIGYAKYLKRRFCSVECFYTYQRKNKPSETEKVARRKKKLQEYYLKRKV